MSDFDPMEAEVDDWMRQFAKIDDRHRPLPDASTLWVKAKLMQSTAAMERASRPITRVQIAAYGLVAGSWAAVLTWKWNALSSWFNSFSPARIVLAGAGASAATSLSLTFFMMLVALASATVMLAFHTILAEE
ncbi:MAG: hypothetical protein M3041_06540 [Acidobacteriota bacterium]|nr:hypothetical protein [Acidobacteriota bacterium]